MASEQARKMAHWPSWLEPLPRRWRAGGELALVATVKASKGSKARASKASSKEAQQCIGYFAKSTKRAFLGAFRDSSERGGVLAELDHSVSFCWWRSFELSSSNLNKRKRSCQGSCIMHALNKILRAFARMNELLARSLVGIIWWAKVGSRAVEGVVVLN